MRRVLFICTMIFCVSANAEQVTVKGKIKDARFNLQGDIEVDVKIKESKLAKRAYILAKKLAKKVERLDEFDAFLEKLNHCTSLEARVFILEVMLRKLMDTPKVVNHITQGVVQKDLDDLTQVFEAEIKKLKEEQQKNRIRLELFTAATLDLNSSMDSIWDAQQVVTGGLSLVIPMQSHWDFRVGGGVGVNTLSKKLGLFGLASYERHFYNYFSVGPAVAMAADKSLNGMNSFSAGGGVIGRCGNALISGFVATVLGVAGEWAHSANERSKEVFGFSVITGLTLTLSAL